MSARSLCHGFRATQRAKDRVGSLLEGLVGGGEESLLVPDTEAVWEPEHAYVTGDLILAGSYVWSCTPDGTSAVDEPAWDLSALYVLDGPGFAWLPLGAPGQIRRALTASLAYTASEGRMRVRGAWDSGNAYVAWDVVWRGSAGGDALYILVGGAVAVGGDAPELDPNWTRFTVRAAWVNPATATPADVVAALIAAGLMAPEPA